MVATQDGSSLKGSLEAAFQETVSDCCLCEFDRFAASRCAFEPHRCEQHNCRRAVPHHRSTSLALGGSQSCGGVPNPFEAVTFAVKAEAADQP